MKQIPAVLHVVSASSIHNQLSYLKTGIALTQPSLSSLLYIEHDTPARQNAGGAFVMTLSFLGLDHQ